MINIKVGIFLHTSRSRLYDCIENFEQDLYFVLWKKRNGTRSIIYVSAALFTGKQKAKLGKPESENY